MHNTFSVNFDECVCVVGT